ncbi:MAG: serine hydrolase domain-containing protein, partial [Planctomycetaceae bacterium]
MWTTDSPQTVGLDADRWRTAMGLMRGWCESDAVPAAAVMMGRDGRMTEPLLCGRQRLAPDSPPVRQDAIFLVASITKPIVAAGVMLLVERGLVTLGDRVAEFLPEFGKHGKQGITLRHLLTHTSGLPDMLPNNQELRAAHAPLSAFLEGICDLKPDFPAGRGVQYQSMGFTVLGELIARITGRSCAEFLKEELFGPLGMKDAALGAPAEWFEGPERTIDRVPEIRPPQTQPEPTDWDWNSRYWRSLGAPWGGLLTTPADLARFAAMLLDGGRWQGRPLLSHASIQAATRNQLETMRGVPADDRRCRPWGLGWRLNWPAHSDNFGDLLGERTFGHWGATGTLMWIDPDARAFAVLLTTQP